MYKEIFSKIWNSKDTEVLLEEINELRKNYIEHESKVLIDKPYLEMIIDYPKDNDGKVRIRCLFDELDRQGVTAKESYINILNDEIRSTNRALQDAEMLKDYNKNADLCQAIYWYLNKVITVRRDFS